MSGVPDIFVRGGHFEYRRAVQWDDAPLLGVALLLKFNGNIALLFQVVQPAADRSFVHAVQLGKIGVSGVAVFVDVG